MLARPNHYIRLAAHEHGALRRIDAINNVKAFTQEAPLHVMFRVFIVMRGYPLGEILRQLGGGPPDPLQNVDLNQVQFRALAQPNYTRWQAVQRALLHLNRLAFRLAASEDDPLGYLTDQDAWRFFLLHHTEFASPDVEKRLKDATKEVEGVFPELILHPNFHQHSEFATLQAKCQALLQPMIAEWNHLKETVLAAAEYVPSPPNSPKSGYTDQQIPKERKAPNTRRLPR